MNAKKSVEDLKVRGKRVLVRCDFNVPLKNGVITDAVGAKCLIEKGIDVGISSYTKLELNPVAEYFAIRIAALSFADATTV